MKKLKKILAPLSVMILLTTWSLPASAVMLWIDQWYNHTHEDYEFHKNDGMNHGALQGDNCGNRNWRETPTTGRHIKLCAGAHIKKVNGGNGYAMPYYGTLSNEEFTLHRYNKGTITMHIAPCGGNDCLFGFNEKSGQPLDKFPITLGKKGNCAISINFVIESNHKIDLVITSDNSGVCAQSEKDWTRLKNNFIDAAPELAAALI